MYRRDRTVKLSVVIVNYNVRDYVVQCLQSVHQALDGIEGEVFVVDNNSPDDSVEVLRRDFPWVRLIANTENVGFSRANNIAIRQSHGMYVLLLNPDTVVEADTFRKVLSFMDAHPAVGGAGVMMHNEDGTLAPESRRALPTPWVACLKMLGFTKRYYMSHLPWDAPAQIEVISGAFCMLRRAALDKIGLLDEDFFMYGEDIDLSYRLLKGGWQNWYLPCPIVHYKGRSTRKTDYRYVHIFYQAMLIFFRKHYRHQSFFFTFPVKVAIYFRAMMALAMMANWRLRKYMGLVNRVVSPIYVLKGGSAMKKSCEEILTRKGLSYKKDFVDKNNVCIVYDADVSLLMDALRSYNRDRASDHDRVRHLRAKYDSHGKRTDRPDRPARRRAAPVQVRP